MLTRFNGNVVPFANDATSTNRTVFGGTTQSDLIDDNLNTNFKKGWEIVGLNDNPTREDFNGMGYTLGALTAYLYEMGISEWNTLQNYRVNSMVIGSDGNLYKSLTGTSGTPNAGNNPLSDVVNWKSLSSDFVSLTGDQTIAGIKTFSSFPITPSSAPTTNYQVANKKYVDDKLVASSETVAGIIELATTAEAQAGTDNSKAITPLKLRNVLTPTIASGTATFIATTNNINLTGIGIGIEIGDVIQISGAEDAKNNSEFTVEVITDANNIIVNQAHANKGTSKNVANRASDTGVTVKLLANWHNAPLGLGQGWVSVKTIRVVNNVYANNTNRTISVSIYGSSGSSNPGTSIASLKVNGVLLAVSGVYNGSYPSSAIYANLSKNDTYSSDEWTGTLVTDWFELR